MCEFVLVLGLMTAQFLMLEMVPDFLVGVPIRRVFGKVEDVQTRLCTNPYSRLFRCVRWCLIHHNDQMSTRMMSEHLMKELDDFSGSDAFSHQSEQQSSPPTEGRRGSHTGAIAGHLGRGCLPGWRPRLAQKRGQRNVGFILEIEDSAVFPDGPPDLRDLVPQPFLSCRLVDLIVFRRCIQFRAQSDCL